MRKLISILSFLSGSAFSAMAQTPVADFTVPPAACTQQNIEFQNNSTNSDRFEWDFCLGDFKTLQNVSQIASLTLGDGFGYKMVEDNGLWTAFAISQSFHKVYRLDFGDSPLNSPLIADLGNPGNTLQFPQDIEIYKHNGNWYGFIGFNDPDYGIVRLDFGTSLSNTPTALNIGNFGVTGRMWDLKVVSQGTDLILVVDERNSGSIVRINFRNSFDNPINPATHVFNTGSITGNLSQGMDLIRKGNNWIALITSYFDSKIHQVNFGSDLLGSHSVSATYSFTNVIKPYRIRLAQEGDSYYAMVSNESLPVSVIDFKDLNPANSPVEINHTGLPVLMGIEPIRYQGQSIIQGVGIGYDNKVRQLIFESICGSTIRFSQVAQPASITYPSGTQSIELKAINSTTNEFALTSRQVIVSSSIAPDIDFFSNGNVCAGNPVGFTSANSSGTIANYDWDFGDLTSHGSGSSTSHSFASGSYKIKLSVTDVNGCINSLNKPIVIYSQPLPNFSLPAPSIVCTNQTYTFVNTSIFDPASNPGWQWHVNGILASSTKDLSQSFNTSANQSIQLTASLPGCASSSAQSFLVQQPGPLVDFSVGTGCIGKPLPFTNLTSGVGITYTWLFGDGNTSTQISPSNTYLTGGPFSTTLTTLSSNGCQNSNSKTVTIYSNPQPDFSVGLPPFSCSNSPTQFQNNTPPLADSNIAGWNWQFGDSGISSQAAPIHTYTLAGPYTAALTATSDKGCSTQVTRIISISASPTADFTVGPACLNISTKFTDISSGGVTSLFWQIASSTFTIPNPSYTFTSSGNYFATLTATSPNGCISVKTKTIIVPVSPTVNFSAANLCSGKNTTFTDITDSPQDVVVGWNWNFAGNSLAGNPATYVFSPDGTFNVKLTTTHASGCKYTLSKNILINPSPVAAFTATPDRGSAPLIVHFNNTSQQATQYIWKFYDKVTATSTVTSPVYTFASLGDYSAELTAANTFGCTDILSVPIKVLVPSIDLVMKDFQLTTDPLTGKIKSVVTILNNSNIPINSAEVALFLADKSVVNETLAINLAPGQLAAKALSFTLSSGQFDFTYLCAEVLSDKDIQSDNNKRCINLEDSGYIFSPYPNPSPGEIHIDWIDAKGGEPVLIFIYDSMGKKTYEWQTFSKEGLNQTIHDLTFLTAGLYFVTVEIGGFPKTMRFLRQ